MYCSKLFVLHSVELQLARWNNSEYAHLGVYENQCIALEAYDRASANSYHLTLFHVKFLTVLKSFCNALGQYDHFICGSSLNIKDFIVCIVNLQSLISSFLTGSYYVSGVSSRVPVCSFPATQLVVRFKCLNSSFLICTV